MAIFRRVNMLDAACYLQSPRRTSQILMKIYEVYRSILDMFGVYAKHT